ncbi:acyl-CoA dehydrogenase [Paenibacillus endophyticus]|uniref:Acyl-CoA dehydrogenase n=1 Tax=Paenibacillus endophyticus TaxID=1294268 RepID=A0A7W5C5J8_9BACL|nr:acyl-CoA dehydrogenase family protein [Paenibacillus endophyticus]MBB3151506.1 acyl-CoA dehydrogenase [Paenibacillus endophyticus]
MQFSLSTEQDMTRAFVREFAECEVAPHASDRDVHERFDRKLFEQMASLGLAAIPISEQYGGAGGDWLTFAIVIEEVSRVCASAAAALAAHTLFAAWPIYAFGNEGLKESYLSRLTSGQLLGGCALPSVKRHGAINDYTLAYSGSKNRRELNGRHSTVLQAGVADLLLVFAQSRRQKRKDESLAFIVERNSPGLFIGENIHKMGLRSLMFNSMHLAHCSAAEACLLSKSEEMSEFLTSLSQLAHISAAAQAVGMAQGAYEAAAAYAKQRKQFGILIGKHQGISFKLANMWTRIEAARLLVYQAAWRRDEGLSCSREAAIARKYSADCAVEAAIEAIQILGGYGYMQEFRMERYLRDAKCLASKLGTGGMDIDCFSHIVMA